MCILYRMGAARCSSSSWHITSCSGSPRRRRAARRRRSPSASRRPSSAPRSARSTSSTASSPPSASNSLARVSSYLCTPAVLSVSQQPLDLVIPCASIVGASFFHCRLRVARETCSRRLAVTRRAVRFHDDQIPLTGCALSIIPTG